MNYFVLYAFWLGVPIGALIVAIWAGGRFFQWLAARRSEDFAGLPSALIGMFLFVACLSPWELTHNFFGEPVAVIGPGNAVKAVIENRQLLWRWDERVSGNRVIDISPIDLSAKMELQPISSNPKVRNLSYTVEVRAIGSPAERLRYLEKFHDHYVYSNGTSPEGDAKEYVMYLLYEFEEHNSIELAKLYNPLDERQQARLLELVSNALDPDLQKVGMKVEGASFGFVPLEQAVTK